MNLISRVGTPHGTFITQLDVTMAGTTVRHPEPFQGACHVIGGVLNARMKQDVTDAEIETVFGPNWQEVLRFVRAITGISSTDANLLTFHLAESNLLDEWRNANAQATAASKGDRAVQVATLLATVENASGLLGSVPLRGLLELWGLLSPCRSLTLLTTMDRSPKPCGVC